MKDQDYVYYRDYNGKVRRVERNYKVQDNMIRLRWMQRPYRWWMSKHSDFKVILIPAIISFISTMIIFQTSMFISQQQVQIQIRSNIPQQIDVSKLKQMKHQ